MTGIKDYIREVVDSGKYFIENTKDVEEKFGIVQEEAENARRTGQEIERRVHEFEFAAQGHIDKVNEILEKYQPKEKPEN